MNRSSDPGHFFETDAFKATRARKASKSANKNGDPIVLQSKILHVISDPFSSQHVFVAESAGCARRINIKNKKTTKVYRGPSAPLTSVAIGCANNSILFGACWDKKIWSWDRENGVTSKTYIGHHDFVKSIITTNLDGKNILISGGADGKIIIWDTATGLRLYTLQDVQNNMLSLQDLAIDPYASTGSQVILFSASSDPVIRQWCLGSVTGKQKVNGTVDPNTTKAKTIKDNIHEHETSVYRILFSGDDEDSNLWTASADGTAKCLSRMRNWATEEVYEHGDYVNAIEISQDFVITAGRDEDVKLWNRNTGTLCHVYEGHFDQVTGLILAEGGKIVVSVSIDGTVRCWPLEKEDLEKEIEKKNANLHGALEEDAVNKPKIHMTAEEIAELAELMETDE
ncbi:putative WD repeat-containing protein [Erysiphe neolycopersici]|uniref:Putative WD repeat-containing protein n=1 Tax=Erysiphe neolycopersici TaxID=212602 RepID=A0A420HSM2_9PEZI|nr:putative WD repeat-containing protein [Erysiphe neolycopersici]